MTIKQIPLFLKNNPEISFSVFGFDVDEANKQYQKPDHFLPKWKRLVDGNKEIVKYLFPLYTTEEQKSHHIDLLLLLQGHVTGSDNDISESFSHFVLINNLGNLIRNGNNGSIQ